LESKCWKEKSMGRGNKEFLKKFFSAFVALANLRYINALNNNNNNNKGNQGDASSNNKKIQLFPFLVRSIFVFPTALSC